MIIKNEHAPSYRKIIFLIILIIGIVFKLFLTWNGNFIFHIDSARDMVDVREMVILEKWRLTGPGTAIDGLFNGPAWYYLLSIPFIISKGNPYASILLQIFLWSVGGYFLLKITSRWGFWLLFPVGFLWIASDYINLTTLYVFNPNPVTLLTPLLIYLICRFLETKKLFFSVSAFLLGGLFFNFEMNFGIFIPFIIILSILFTKKTAIFKIANLWIGVLVYLLCLMPQAFFDIKHNFLMFKAITGHIHRESKQLNISNRFNDIKNKFFDNFIATILNRKLIAMAVIIFSIPVLTKFFKESRKDIVVIITLMAIIVPFIGFLLIPVTVNPWHLGAVMSASIILIAFVLRRLWDLNLIGKIISFSIAFSILFFSLFNIFKFFIYDRNIPNMDPSLFKNEIAAIDYVYRYAQNKNFKVYTYLPSIIDYPYQYLIWWYGLKEFGYLPIDYAYAPNQFDYISNKKAFSATENSLKQRPNSNLVFLIKEPDRNYTRFGWEGNFVKLQTVEKQMVGPIEIDVRKEVNK